MRRVFLSCLTKVMDWHFNAQEGDAQTFSATYATDFRWCSARDQKFFIFALTDFLCQLLNRTASSAAWRVYLNCAERFSLAFVQYAKLLASVIFFCEHPSQRHSEWHGDVYSPHLHIHCVAMVCKVSLHILKRLKYLFRMVTSFAPAGMSLLT